MRQTPEPMSASPEDDDTLMAAYARGEAAAFEQLYERHRLALYRFVRRLLGSANAAQVDEVFQDTWLRVVQARARWQPHWARPISSRSRSAVSASSDGMDERCMAPIPTHRRRPTSRPGPRALYFVRCAQ